MAGGADFIELGMPFSDPLAEGLPIQRVVGAGARATASPWRRLRTARAFTARHPVRAARADGLLSTRCCRSASTAFCGAAAKAGAAGLILPDLPPEECRAARSAARAHGLALTFLVAPNTPEARVLAVAERSTGFVYAVSTPGLTGQTLAGHDAIGAYLDRTRALVGEDPLLVGFGIRTRDDAARLAAHTDGFIVGTALIEICERLWDDSRP